MAPSRKILELGEKGRRLGQGAAPLPGEHSQNICWQLSLGSVTLQLELNWFANEKSLYFLYFLLCPSSWNIDFLVQFGRGITYIRWNADIKRALPFVLTAVMCQAWRLKEHSHLLKSFPYFILQATWSLSSALRRLLSRVQLPRYLFRIWTRVIIFALEKKLILRIIKSPSPLYLSLLGSFLYF